MTSVNSVSRPAANGVSGPVTWGNVVSEGGLGPVPGWYITETVIHHHPKLAQPRAGRAGISPPRGGGSASRLRSPGA